MQESVKTTRTDDFKARVSHYMPRLFMIWLLLSVLAPHQEIYKIFFHIIVIPAILVVLFTRQSRINWRDPLLITTFILVAYSSLATFVVGTGPWSDHFRAFRWGVETVFCLMAFYLWLPGVLKAPRWWGRFFILLSLLGAFGGFSLLAFGLIQGRLSGLGALHNPIQASSILIIYLAIGYCLIFMRKRPLQDQGSVWLMVPATIAVSMFVLMSQSRAPIIALVFFLLFLMYGLLTRINLLKTAALLAGGSGLVAGLLSLIYGIDHYKDLLLFRGWSYRLEIWEGYLAYPPKSWFFGFGAGTDPSQLQAAKEIWKPAGLPVTHAHNLWLGTLVETGIIGLALLTVIAVLLLKSALSYRRGDILPSGRLMLLFLVFMLTLTGSHTLVISIKAVWLFGWLPLLLVWFSRLENEKLTAS